MSRATESKEAREKRRGGLLVVVALVVLAMLLGWCGRGWIGGGGDGSGDGERAENRESEPDEASETEPRGVMGEGGAPAEPCEVRIDGDGLQLAGARAELAAAVEACAEAGRAELTVTGEAIYGLVRELEAAFDERGVEVVKK